MSATIGAQLDELRELIEITGATGVRAALSRVACLVTMEERLAETRAQKPDPFYQHLETLRQYAEFLPPAYCHAVLHLVHEYERVVAMAVPAVVDEPKSITR